MQKGFWISLYLGIPKLWENLDIFPNMMYLENEENHLWEVKVLKHRKDREIRNTVFGLIFPVVHLFFFSSET